MSVSARAKKEPDYLRIQEQIFWIYSRSVSGSGGFAKMNDVIEFIPVAPEAMVNRFCMVLRSYVFPVSVVLVGVPLETLRIHVIAFLRIIQIKAQDQAAKEGGAR
jgi:hypothetical protein